MNKPELQTIKTTLVTLAICYQFLYLNNFFSVYDIIFDKQQRPTIMLTVVIDGSKLSTEHGVLDI